MAYTVHLSKNQQSIEYVILSSGLGGHASFWNPQLEDLLQFFHVISYDQEGCHAYDEPLVDDYSMTNMARQVLEIVQLEKIEKFHFIGHALGGHIGAELAILLEKENIELLSLTSINAWDELDPHTQKCFEARKSLLVHAGAEAYVKAQALFLYPPAWISKHINSIHLAEKNQLADFPPQHNVLSRLKALEQFKITDAHVEALAQCKIHLIANRDDFLVPVQKTFDLQARLGNAQVSVFDDGAHASTVTCTEQVNKAILKFLIH